MLMSEPEGMACFRNADICKNITESLKKFTGMSQLPFRKFSISKRIKSFHFAFEGIAYFFRQEHNAWIHAVVTLLVLIAATILKVSKAEMIIIIFAIALVWITEMFNTAIEELLDHLSPQINPRVKVIKDIAAGAVLIASIAAVIIGLIIFIPKIL